MSLSQLIGPCWIIRLESALISPARFCITAQQERAGRDLAEVPVGGAGGWMNIFTPCRLLAGRAGDEEMGPRQRLRAFEPLSTERVRKVALEELEPRVGCARE